MFSHTPENKEENPPFPEVHWVLPQFQLPVLKMETPRLLDSLFKVPLRECKNPNPENEKMASLGRLPNPLWLAITSYLELNSLAQWLRSCKKLIQIGNHNSLRIRLYEAKTKQETKIMFSNAYLGLIQPEIQKNQEMRSILNTRPDYLQPNEVLHLLSEEETYLYNDNPISGFIMKRSSS